MHLCGEQKRPTSEQSQRTLENDKQKTTAALYSGLQSSDAIVPAEDMPVLQMMLRPICKHGTVPSHQLAPFIALLQEPQRIERARWTQVSWSDSL
jgi:hypothetical protein